MRELRRSSYFLAVLIALGAISYAWVPIDRTVLGSTSTCGFPLAAAKPQTLAEAVDSDAATRAHRAECSTASRDRLVFCACLVIVAGLVALAGLLIFRP